jgi:hypothetical protein
MSVEHQLCWLLAGGAAADHRGMGRVVRNIVLHGISAGMLVAAIASADPFWHEFELVMAAGAFALAWLAPD